MKRSTLAFVLALLAALVAGYLFLREGDAPPLPPPREVEFIAPADVAADARTGAGGTAASECTTVVRARFLDPEGRPVSGARLSCAWPRGSATSGADGRVTLALALLARSQVRTLQLRASAPGYANATWTARAKEDESTDLGDVVLGPAGRVRGRVLDEQGRGLAMAEVRAVPGLGAEDSARFHGPADAVASVATSADGSFELDGVPVGPVRVWAGSTMSFWSASEVLEVAAGLATTGVQLVVLPIPPENVIDVAVIDPAGEPVARAQVLYRRRGGRSPAEGRGETDERGRWRLVAEERVQHDLRVSDPEGRLRAGRIEGVEPGSGEVVIALAEPSQLRVLVRDPDGAPLESALARVVERSAFGPLESLASPTDVPGTLALPLPLEAFELEISADGFRSARVGPLDPREAGAEIAVSLAPLPRLAGLVHHDGEPVAGARVALHPTPAEGTALTVNGFPARCEPIPAATATTAADGSFALALRVNGTFVLRVTAPEWAPAEAGPFALDGETGAEGLNLELARGGTLEGQVSVDPGEALAGRLVVLSCGDGHALTVRSDETGRFRVERLSPGRWWVGASERELELGSFQLQRAASAVAQEVPWNCEVRDGETTRVEVSFRAELRAHVRGRLALGGRPASEWEVRLLPREGDPKRAPRRARLSTDGSFDLGSPVAGPVVLSFHDPLRGAAAITLDVELTLAEGELEWSLDLDIARAQGRVLTFGAGERSGLGWRFDDGALHARGELATDADGTFVIPRVPAGELRFVRRDADGGDIELKRAQVPARATLDLEL